jgi:hypothetical protein
VLKKIAQKMIRLKEQVTNRKRGRKAPVYMSKP